MKSTEGSRQAREMFRRGVTKEDGKALGAKKVYLTSLGAI